jgi:hypothetical protein
VRPMSGLASSALAASILSVSWQMTFGAAGAPGGEARLGALLDQTTLEFRQRSVAGKLSG